MDRTLTYVVWSVSNFTGKSVHGNEFGFQQRVYLSFGRIRDCD